MAAANEHFDDISDDFFPSHRITLDAAAPCSPGPLTTATIDVMLVSGSGYTRAEWDAEDAAAFERDEEGAWTFQGEVFNGTVEALSFCSGCAAHGTATLATMTTPAIVAVDDHSGRFVRAEPAEDLPSCASCAEMTLDALGEAN